MDNPIQLSQNSEPSQIVTPEQRAILNRYTNPGDLANRLIEFNWNPDKELAEVIELAQQDDKLAVKMSAIRFLRQLVTDTMAQSGMIATITQSQRKDGISTTLSTKVVADSLPYYKQPQQPQQPVISEVVKGAEPYDNIQEIAQENIQETSPTPTTPATPASTDVAAGSSGRDISPADAGDPVSPGTPTAPAGAGNHKPPVPDPEGQFRGIAASMPPGTRP
jgi:hypothetical protein